MSERGSFPGVSYRSKTLGTWVPDVLNLREMSVAEAEDETHEIRIDLGL